MSIETGTAMGMMAFGLPILLLMLHPILTRAGRQADDDVAARQIEELLTEREQSYTALADLDFDFECDKISEQDYRRLRGELVRETSVVLGQIDDMITEKRSATDGPTRGKRPKAKPTVAVGEDAVEREISRFEQQRAKTKKGV